jgi:aryl-alcohol dehydrogenase-like predicted oxidoreductase
MGPDTRFASDDWRSKYFGPDNLGRTLERVERLKPILPPGMSLPEMALRFILSTPVVSTTIVGMREPEHVDQNLALSDRGGLPPALIAQLRQHRWNRVPQAWSD